MVGVMAEVRVGPPESNVHLRWGIRPFRWFQVEPVAEGRHWLFNPRERSRGKSTGSARSGEVSRNRSRILCILRVYTQPFLASACLAVSGYCFSGVPALHLITLFFLFSIAVFGVVTLLQDVVDDLAALRDAGEQCLFVLLGVGTADAGSDQRLEGQAGDVRANRLHTVRHLLFQFKRIERVVVDQRTAITEDGLTVFLCFLERAAQGQGRRVN